MMKVHSSKPYASFPHFFLSNKECDDKYCKCTQNELLFQMGNELPVFQKDKWNSLGESEPTSLILLAGMVASMPAPVSQSFGTLE